jgi:hypothetical protein
MSEFPRAISQLLWQLLWQLRDPECWADEDAAADAIETLIAENQQLRHDCTVFMDCRRGKQRCDECPDTNCWKNRTKQFNKAESEVNDE